MGPDVEFRDYLELFEKMSVDELWALHERTRQILAAKLSARKEDLEARLEHLRQSTDGGGPAKD